MPVCDDRSILDLVAIQVDTVRPYVCLTTLDDTLYLTSHFGCRDANGQAAQSRAVLLLITALVPCDERLRRSALLAYEGAKYDFYSSSWEHLVSFYLPLGN